MKLENKLSKKKAQDDEEFHQKTIEKAIEYYETNYPSHCAGIT